MPIIRRHPRRFTIVPNETIESGLSFEALGVLTYLLSKPDDWTIHTSEIRKRGGIGKYKMQRIMRELREAGLLHLETARDDETGKMKGQVYVLYDVPYDPETREPENPAVGKPGPILNTDSLPNTDDLQQKEPPLFSRQDIAPDVDDGNVGEEKTRRKKRTPVTFRKSEYAGRVPPEWITWARERGLSEREAAVEADRFATYWNEGRGRDTRRADWRATWRNWVAKRGSYTPEHLSAVQEASPSVSDTEWRRRVEMMRRMYGDVNVAIKRWPQSWGPPPGSDGCLCPMDIWMEVWK